MRLIYIRGTPVEYCAYVKFKCICVVVKNSSKASIWLCNRLKLAFEIEHQKTELPDISVRLVTLLIFKRNLSLEKQKIDRLLSILAKTILHLLQEGWK